MAIKEYLIKSLSRRPPDFIIGGQERPYLLRWFVIPRNPVFNIYLHQFLRSDDDRALHDHPWLFNLSWLLRGEYVEHTIRAGGVLDRTHRCAGAIKLRFGAAPHRVELVDGDHPEGPSRPCWTLFITGPRIREWGFYCMERGWVHWKRFTAPNDKGAVGPGCAG